MRTRVNVRTLVATTNPKKNAVLCDLNNRKNNLDHTIEYGRLFKPTGLISTSILVCYRVNLNVKIEKFTGEFSMCPGRKRLV